MSKETGGLAFPREDYQANGVDGFSNGLGQEGMTLRDYFAAKYMQGVSSKSDSLYRDSDLADEAYKMADAMLAERSKP